MDEIKELITPEGYAKLEAEIKQLKDVERPSIIDAVASAREHGDLRENAEYQTARDRQNYIEARMMKLDEFYRKCKVINPANITKNDTVFFGCTVELLDCDTNKNITLTIVGEYESDFKIGRISYKSPIGKELMEKSVGDFITVELPAKKTDYEILSIKNNYK